MINRGIVWAVWLIMGIPSGSAGKRATKFVLLHLLTFAGWLTLLTIDQLEKMRAAVPRRAPGTSGILLALQRRDESMLIF